MEHKLLNQQPYINGIAWTKFLRTRIHIFSPTTCYVRRTCTQHQLTVSNKIGPSWANKLAFWIFVWLVPTKQYTDPRLVDGSTTTTKQQRGGGFFFSLNLLLQFWFFSLSPRRKDQCNVKVNVAIPEQLVTTPVSPILVYWYVQTSYWILKIQQSNWNEFPLLRKSR